METLPKGLRWRRLDGKHHPAKNFCQSPTLRRNMNPTNATKKQIVGKNGVWTGGITRENCSSHTLNKIGLNLGSGTSGGSGANDRSAAAAAIGKGKWGSPALLNEVSLCAASTPSILSMLQ